MHKLLLSICFFVVSGQLAAHVNPVCLNVLKQLASEYTRPFTVLELGFSGTEYAFGLATQYAQASCISIVYGNAQASVLTACKNKIANCVILNPRSLALKDLRMLSRCEHFDVVIVKEAHRIAQCCGAQCMDVLSNLGDFIITQLQPKDMNLLKTIDPKQVALYPKAEGTIALCSMHKRGLDIARWTQKLPVSSTPRYVIKSDFNEKLFYKKSAEKATNWIRGINLVTFVMLRGLYPTDNCISRSLIELQQRFPQYNDGVIGNMIIDGTALKLIDFDDKRRHSNMKKCISQALKLFNNDKSRLINPTERIKEYYYSL